MSFILVHIMYSYEYLFLIIIIIIIIIIITSIINRESALLIEKVTSTSIQSKRHHLMHDELKLQYF